MNVMVKLPEAEEYEPTESEKNMARSVQFLVSRMLRGELKGIALCAINQDDEESAFYLNSGPDDILRGPIERLRTMYATNRMMGRQDTTPIR